MTEYDYSPGAIERYQEKLRSIGRWAEETSHHRPANPYLPTTPAMHVATLRADNDFYYSSPRKSNSSSSSRERHRSRSVDQGSSRPSNPTRSNTYGSGSTYTLQRPHTGHSTPRYPPPPTYPNPVSRKDNSRSSSRSHGPSMSTSSLPHAHPQPRRSNTMPHAQAPHPAPHPAPMQYRQPPVRSNTTGHTTPAAYTNLYYPPYKEPVVIPTGAYAVLPGGVVQTPIMTHPIPAAVPTPTKSSWLSKLTGGILGSPKSPPPSPNHHQPIVYMPSPDVKRSKSHKHKSSRSRSSKRHGHGRSGERRYSY
ncbi:hypothetical protein Moror_1162 [Moniliophthora roreri MCA 2997]|uniref:Uncharacterized protein n=2 Tax=Moniliophthora roreri TaxID=221103 RepID=V2XBF9_MONRO|nr:hypothetical protein Moror_1162 [Moniliophthora roreri MCA 2997]KAI3610113.1 hypothetical protein WG66_007416 [Moniliophthora roreri]